MENLHSPAPGSAGKSDYTRLPDFLWHSVTVLKTREILYSPTTFPRGKHNGLFVRGPCIWLHIMDAKVDTKLGELTTSGDPSVLHDIATLATNPSEMTFRTDLKGNK